MHLRKIDRDDSVFLISWRNDNARYFPAGPALTWESHLGWYENYIRNISDHMYLVCDEKPVGTIAVNVSTREIGRVLRGEQGVSPGAMGWALEEIMRVYSRGYGGHYDFWLRVLKQNEHAVAFYQRHRFHSWKIDNEFLTMYCTRRPS